MQKLTVSLDRFETELALRVGDGDLGLGIRRALVLAGLRMETETATQMNQERKTPDRLTIIANQMDVLARELRRLGKDDPEKRVAIVNQLIKLGKLYLAIRSGSDVSFEDR